MTMIDRVSIALGRISISILFLVRALSQALDWRAADQEVAMVFMDWREVLQGWGLSHGFLNLTYQYTHFLIFLGIIGGVCGALALLFGVKTKSGAALLILVWLPMVVFQHPFWLLEGIQREQELLGFFLNLAVLGGLFILFGSFGARRKYENSVIRFRGDE